MEGNTHITTGEVLLMSDISCQSPSVSSSSSSSEESGSCTAPRASPRDLLLGPSALRFMFSSLSVSPSSAETVLFLRLPSNESRDFLILPGLAIVDACFEVQQELPLI